MMQRFLVFIIVLITPFTMFSQSKISNKQLKQNISDTLGRQQGIFAVHFKNLSTGEQVMINEQEVFHAASTMKTPVMIEVFKQAKAGNFSLSDSIVLKNEFNSIVDGSPYQLNPADDSELELYKHAGEKRSVHDLLYQMIIASSNFATNLMIQLVNAKNVTQTMRSFGANDIQVLRGVEDQKAFDSGLNNTVTAHDLALIFEKIATGAAVDKKSSDAMISVLLDQQFNDVIPAKLPAGVKVAHKTGSITGVHHDSGIIFLPDDRKYVLVLLSKKIQDEPAAVNAMATVSEMIYRYVVGK